MKTGGQICFVSTLWSIWLARNDCVFNNVKISPSKMDFIIKHRAYSWSLAANLVSKGHDQIWNCYPMQSYLIHNKRLKRDLVDYWLSLSDLLCFTDGAWKLNQNNTVEAGIGGFIMNKNHQVIFIFSGPSLQVNAYETEKEALSFLLSQIEVSSHATASFTFLLDSTLVVNQINKQKRTTPVQDFCIKVKNDLLHCSNFISIPRSVNSEADSLAKQGSQRMNFLAGWI